MNTTRVNVASPAFTLTEKALLGAFLTIASGVCGAAMAGAFIAITVALGG